MKKLTGNLLIALTASLCFFTCQQNEEIIEPEIPTSIVEEVDLHSNPHLKGLVQGINNQATSNGRTNSLLDNVDFSQASKYYDSAYQVTKYTFSTNNSDDYTPQNFILMEPDHGDVFGLIFTHQLDLEWYSQYDEFPGWDQFTGTLYIQDIEGNLISESKIENGKSVDGSNENGRTAGTTCVTEYILHQKDWYVNGVYDWTENWITTETTCYSTGGGAGSSSDSPNIKLDPNSDVIRPGDSDFSKPNCGANSSYNLSRSSCECYEGFVMEGGSCISWENWIDDKISDFQRVMDCDKMTNLHGQSRKDQWDFYMRYRGWHKDDIINETDDRSITGLGSQPGGPETEFRFIEDPLNPNLIIDMRHLLIIGDYGRAIGESVEFIQYLDKDSRESAFDDQDYYSNELGYSFYSEFGAAIESNPTGLADYLITFLNNESLRNSISNPNRCR